MSIHFETLSPGMKAKLDPTYRILQSQEFTDYLAKMKELLQSSLSAHLSSAVERKKTGTVDTGADYRSKQE